MAIEIVDLAIQNGGSFHSVLYVYQRVLGGSLIFPSKQRIARFYPRKKIVPSNFPDPVLIVKANETRLFFKGEVFARGDEMPLSEVSAECRRTGTQLPNRKYQPLT